MSEDRKTNAVERLREATTNHEAVWSFIISDSSGPDDMAPGESFESYMLAQNAQLQAIRNVAIAVVGEVYHEREDLDTNGKYAEVEDVIEQANARWLYPVILERALDAAGGA